MENLDLDTIITIHALISAYQIIGGWLLRMRNLWYKWEGFRYNKKHVFYITDHGDNDMFVWLRSNTLIIAMY